MKRFPVNYMFILLKTDHNNQNTAGHQSVAVSNGDSRFDEPRWSIFRIQLMRHALLSTEFGHFDMLVDCFNTCCCEIIIIYYHLLNCVRKTEGKESNLNYKFGKTCCLNLIFGDCVLHSAHWRASVELRCHRSILVTLTQSATCKVICAINRRLLSAASCLLHNFTHFMHSHLSTMPIAFVNKSIAFCFHTSNIGIQVQPKAAESLQRSVCSWAVLLAHRQVCSPTRGPRGKRNVHGASQLGLVYFSLLSIKRHFLVLIA